MSTRIALVLLALLPAVAGFAQGFWQKKAPGQWSARECESLLTDSPWAKSRILGDVLIEDLEKPGSIEGREGHPWISYTARFWSAQPVRQAYVRQLRLSKDFLALLPERKQTAEESHQRLLNTEFSDRIVLMIVCTTNFDAYKRDLIRYWQTRPGALWAMDTFLITSKGRIPPLAVGVVPGEGGQFELHFPRTLNKQPVVGPADKSISIEFIHPDTGVLRTERILFNFKVKDMILGGVPIY
jgi:hypothetical protein